MRINEIIYIEIFAQDPATEGCWIAQLHQHGAAKHLKDNVRDALYGCSISSHNSLSLIYHTFSVMLVIIISLKFFFQQQQSRWFRTTLSLIIRNVLKETSV